jgi:hypothetical protein
MKKNEVVTIECIDCGVTFDVSADEQAWYKEKGFELPKRCHKCRKARRGKTNNKRK